MELLDKAELGALWHAALVVQRGEDALALAVDERELRRVVGELDRLDVDALALVLLDAQLHQRVHEGRLQLLVGEVDAELLERVEPKVLEAEDVEQADEALLVGGRPATRSVDALRLEDVERADDPLEDGLVHRLGEGVARVDALLLRQVDGVRRLATPGGDLAGGQLLLEHRLLHTEQRRDATHPLGVGRGELLLRLAREVEVARREDRRDHRQHAVALLALDAEDPQLGDRLGPVALVVHVVHAFDAAAEVRVLIVRLEELEFDARSSADAPLSI